ncbi:stage III sporulation protein AF [Paenibacillus glycinis]|uniref:Stage III sporulation protein AF n=1 Tax=Paenibacillus glycinis TaxID=2697035 RepID=A0ABW9XJA4_9BACL|nr:stage III sporulation protein AF [Paenibacillus glycinis]NBD22690.1 stage III sporulation protein AF [Paenibacillus glycinis]
MLNWLAVWLQQIIAVVLLAGFIDLLLPNKGMQRYVRLVAGLIILLTILTPIIRVLQGDFSAKLDAQVEEWINADSSKDLRMPTLQDIQEDAKALKQKEAASASALAEQRIAEAMKTGIEQSTGLKVAAVDVKMTADRSGQPVQLSGVTVTLVPAEQAPPDEGTAADGGTGPNAAPVDEVQAVQVDVTPSSDATPNDGDGGAYRPASATIAGAVQSVLREGWSVNPAAVEVLEPAPAAASAR